MTAPRTSEFRVPGRPLFPTRSPTFLRQNPLKKRVSPKFENTRPRRSKFTFNLGENCMRKISSCSEKLKEWAGGRGALTANRPEPSVGMALCRRDASPPYLPPRTRTPTPPPRSGDSVPLGDVCSQGRAISIRQMKIHPSVKPGRGRVKSRGGCKGRELPKAASPPPPHSCRGPLGWGSAGVRADGWPFGSPGLSKRSSFFRISVPSLCLSCRAGWHPTAAAAPGRTPPLAVHIVCLPWVFAFFCVFPFLSVSLVSQSFRT